MTPPNNTVAGLAEKLLPCPFCGSESIDEKGWASANSAGPACDKCGASAGCVSSNLAENIAAWNRRASPAPSAGVGVSVLPLEAATDAGLTCDDLLGDWIPGSVTPAESGTYLRQFDDDEFDSGETEALSSWNGIDQWSTGDASNFFAPASPEQQRPWRGVCPRKLIAALQHPAAPSVSPSPLNRTDSIFSDWNACCYRDQCRENARRLATAEQPAIDLDACVNRFLGWKLPEGFGPDCGISFTPPKWPNTWPIGTNLLTAVQARAMLEYVLNWTAGAPSAQQPLDGPANNAGVAAGSRNGPPSESVTRGNPPSTLEQPGSAVQGDALAEQYRKGWEAGHATAHRIRNALATQHEARGVEGMVLVPSGVMKRIERDYEEWGKTAFAAYVRDLLAAEQTESRWNFAGIDLAPDLLRLVGIKNAIGANPDGQACFDSAASELARKMLNEFQKQWTDCAPLNTPNNREK